MKPLRSLLIAAVAVGGISLAYAAGAASFPQKLVSGIEAAGWDHSYRKADYDDDEHEGHRHLRGEHERHHEDGDDDDGWRFGRNGSAPAGSTTPPDNGLILKGTAPKVQVN
jgi:hypothetical protein